MAQEIALKLTINGTQQTIKSIDQLEQSISDLNKQLKSTEIGSQEFKNLTRELQSADSQLKTLKKTYEGLEPQQKAEAFLKLGEGLAGSFAIATSALQLFGSESEDIAEAQLKVQQAISIALGARQVAEAALQLKIVANTIAQKAYNLSVTAGTSITRGFFAVIAANPIGALVTAIGLAITAISLFGEEEEKVVETTKELNNTTEDVIKTNTTNISQLKILTNILNDTTKSEELRLAALEEIKTIVPEVTAAYLDDANSLDIVNQAIDDYISNARLKIEVDALLVQTTELQNQLLENQQRIQESTNLVIENGVKLIRLVNITEEQYQQLLIERSRLTDELNSKNDRLNIIIGELILQQSQSNRLSEEAKQKLEAENKAREVSAEKIKLQNEQFKKQITEIQNLGKELTLDYENPPLLVKIREMNNEMERLKKTYEQTFDSLFKETFELPQTVFSGYYEAIRNDLTASVFDPELLKTNVEKYLSEAVNLLNKGEITQEDFNLLRELTDGYLNVSELIKEFPEFGEIFTRPDGYFQVLRNEFIATGKILFKETENGIEMIDETDRSVEKIVKSRENLALIEKELTDLAIQRLTLISEEEKRSGGLGLTTQQIEERAKETVNSLKTTISSVTLVEEQVREVLFNYSNAVKFKIMGDMKILTSERKQFILENIDLIAQESNIELDTRRRLFGEKKRLAENEVKINEDLAKKNIDITQFETEKQAELYDAYYTEYEERARRAQEATASETQLFFQGLSESLQQIVQTSQIAVQTVQLAVQTSLQVLQKQQEGLLDQVVGNTEEAEKKRTEINEEYEEKRKAITKKGQIAQLELTRVQALANVAESITKAFATGGPVLGQVLAGLSAALGAIQVGVITSQIATVKNLRRGGMLFGPSHEQGGIPLGNTGVYAEGGEMVVNRQSSVNYRNLLSTINQSGGGRPVIDATMGSERLMEALAKTRNEPIRAYVLSDEITNNQSINKRLEELSKI